jgi:hypothetical protein
VREEPVMLLATGMVILGLAAFVGMYLFIDFCDRV